jgi:hypothetical protein
MARTDVDLDRLRSPTNEAYLVAASGLITAALILRAPRHEAMYDRHKELHDAIHRIRLRILEARAAGISLNDLVERNSKKKKEEEEKEVADEPRPHLEDYSSYFDYGCRRSAHFLRLTFHH